LRFFPKSLGLLTAGFLLACQVPATQQPQFEKNLTLLSVLPLSGSLKSKGPSRQRAADLAASQINQAGGVNAQEIRLEHIDSGTQSSTAINAVRPFLAAHPETPFLIGASSSQVSRALLEEVTKHETLMISPASTASFFTGGDPEQHFFRTAPSDAYQGNILAQRMIESGLSEIGVLHLNDTYGNSLKETLSTALLAEGARVMASDSYDAVDFDQPQSITALQDKVKSLLNTPIQALCLVGYPAEAPLIFNAWLESGLLPDLRWFFSDGLKAAEIVKGVTSPNRLDQSLGTVPSSAPREESSRFESDYLAAYNELPVSFAANTYDAVALAAFALQRFASKSTPSLRQALQEVSSPPGIPIGTGVAEFKRGLEALAQGKDIDYQGASGIVDLDAQGDVLSDYEIWTLKKGFIFRVETRSSLIQD